MMTTLACVDFCVAMVAGACLIITIFGERTPPISAHAQQKPSPFSAYGCLPSRLPNTIPKSILMSSDPTPARATEFGTGR
jgi:hypothetical protein